MGARRWARITLVVLVIGCAFVIVPTGRGLWEWAVYSDWELSDPLHHYPIERLNEISIFARVDMIMMTAKEKLYLYELKRKHWSWVPGSGELRREISLHEYCRLLGEYYRRAKAGQ